MRRRTFLQSIAAAVVMKALPAPAAPRALVGDGQLHIPLDDKQVADLNRARISIRERRHVPMWDTILRASPVGAYVNAKYARRGRR